MRIVLTFNFACTVHRQDGSMKMITDSRSAKASQSSDCELCWWFPLSSEQYRISGTLRYIGADEMDPGLRILRKESWGNLSDRAREQFFWVRPITRIFIHWRSLLAGACSSFAFHSRTRSTSCWRPRCSDWSCPRAASRIPACAIGTINMRLSSSYGQFPAD